MTPAEANFIERYEGKKEKEICNICGSEKVVGDTCDNCEKVIASVMRQCINTIKAIIDSGDQEAIDVMCDWIEKNW